METIESSISHLVKAIKQSDEYETYKKCEAQLALSPELFHRVEEFCALNFRLQNHAEPSELMAALDVLNKESEELGRMPKAYAYLQAELNLCKLLQSISLDVNGSLGIHIPKLQENEE